MTDNTQELDKIIEHAYNAGYSAKDMVKQAILDWHNKQVEAKLVHMSEYAENVASVDENGEFRMKAIPLSLIAVEINKLRERDDE